MLDWFDYHGHMCLAFDILGLSVFDFLVSILTVHTNKLLPLEHDHGQTDSRARTQRLSAAHHKVTWSLLIGFIY